jgi:hypothetical protein
VKDKFLLLLGILSFCLLFVTGIRGVEETAEIRLRIEIPKIDLNIILVNEKPYYCSGDVVNVSNELKNVGEVDALGNLSTKVWSENTMINQTDWFGVSVLTGKTVYKNTSYTVREEDEIGLYTITSNYSYVGNFTFASHTFSIHKDIGFLTTDGDKIVLTIPPGKSGEHTLQLYLRFACENATARMNVSSGLPGEWTSFDPEEVFLLSTGYKNSTNVRVTVPNDTELGTYYGWIHATADDQIVDVNLTVIVSAYFYLKVKIPEDKKEVCLGDDVYAEVNITKISPPGEVEVNMSYQILHEDKVLAETKENLTLNDTMNSVIRVPVLKVPSDAGEGNYTFLAVLEYNETWFASSDTFRAKSCIPVTTAPTPTPEAKAPAPAPAPPAKGLALNLSTNLLSVTTGNKTSFVATVKNIGTQTIKSVRISVEGIPKNWIEILPSSIDIPPGSVQSYLVLINIPSDAKTGVYDLKVRATDEVESNTETLTLIIGKNMKEIADLLLEEFKGVRTQAEVSLLVEDCVDVTIIKTIHEDAKLAFEKGLDEYKKGNYVKAINWFEYAIPVEMKVVSRVDVILEMEVEASKKSRVIIPPFFDPEDYFLQAETYLDEKNYERICDPIERIRKFMMIGLVFWPAIVIVSISLIIVIVIEYRRKRKRERARILELVRKRLRS